MAGRRWIWVWALVLVSISSGAQEFSAVQLRSLELQEMGSDGVFSPFGTYFAVISRTNRVRVYNSDYDQVWSYRGRGQHGTGPAIAFTSDERYLLFPGHGSESRIAMVNAASGELVATYDGHDAEIKALALSPDDRWLVSVQYGGRTIVWEREGREFVRLHDLDRPDRTVTALAFSPNSDSFAMGNNEDWVELFALDSTGESGDGQFVPAGELRPNQYYGNTGYIQGLDYSPDGRLLATAVRNEITIWELDRTDLISTTVIPDLDQGYCYSLDFAPDGNSFVAGFQGSRAAIWERTDDGWTHRTTFTDRQDYVWDVAVSPDGTQLATVSVTSNGVAIWELSGSGPGPLVQVSRMLSEASGGDAPGMAHRTVLSESSAVEILSGIDPDLIAPRGMFESAAAFEDRIQLVNTQVLVSVQEALARAHGAEISGIDGGPRTVSAPLEMRGTYDIDAMRYTTSALGSTAHLAIPPAEAEGLYVNWERARVEAEGDVSGVFGGYELVHPVSGERFSLVMSEDPLSGKRLEPTVIIGRPLRITSDLVIEDLRFEPVFPSLYRAYEQIPIGRASLFNSGDLPVEQMELSAVMAKYSAEPARIELPRALPSGERVEITIPLILSEAIVSSGGEETLSVEISADHTTEGENRTGAISALVQVLNRNSIRWDDDLKVGAFMTTVQSPTVMTLAGQAASDSADDITAALPRQLVIAMRVLELLRARDIAYRVDPASAYENLSQSAGAIDFLQFPTETLAYGAGDCDDLSVLYNSILEAAGVRTAFITTPGHIFTAFSLDRRADEVSGVFPDAGEFVVVDGRAWIPVETTVLSRGFREAWQVGARQWRSAQAARTGRIFTTDEAWRLYPPVPWEPDVRSLDPARPGDRFGSELEGYVEEAVNLMIHERGVGSPESAREFNIRGTIYARFGLLDDASKEFQTAVDMDDYVPALMNLAAVAGLRGNHDSARQLLQVAAELSPDNPRILLGLAVEHLEDGDRADARGYFDRATEIDPNLALVFPLFGSSVATSESGGARASGEDAIGTYRMEAWEE